MLARLLHDLSLKPPVLALFKTITGQMAADLAPEPSMHSSGYNISVNLSSIFTLPSRLLARIRRVDDFLAQDEMSSIGIQVAPNHLSKSRLAIDPFPRPWGFFLSGYMFGIFALVMA